MSTGARPGSAGQPDQPDEPSAVLAALVAESLADRQKQQEHDAAIPAEGVAPAPRFTRQVSRDIQSKALTDGQTSRPSSALNERSNAKQSLAAAAESPIASSAHT